jgi:hypothetical protein
MTPQPQCDLASRNQASLSATLLAEPASKTAPLTVDFSVKVCGCGYDRPRGHFHHT